MPLTERRPRGPGPPRTPGSRGAAVPPKVPPAATTWKLRIPWKLFLLTGGFISAGRKVSTLMAGPAPTARLLPGARSQWHRASLKLTALCYAPRSTVIMPSPRGNRRRGRPLGDPSARRAANLLACAYSVRILRIERSFHNDVPQGTDGRR
jgi:hypothetical protein